MKLLAFDCERFAGLSNKRISFKDGLNIILGPNEAGKTTIVEGIFATLFYSHKLRKNTRKGKDFFDSYIPHPRGDTIKTRLTFVSNGKKYDIEKAWGARSAVRLQEGGNLYYNENQINMILREVLEYGESTYEKIVFAKQKDIKEVLEKIREDEETIQTLGELMRRAIMELDGVSVEKLKSKIQDEFKNSSGKWDIYNNRPEKGRGINDPWKREVGTVLNKYYEKETILKEMQDLQRLEEEYQNSVEKLKRVKTQKNEIDKKIEKYSKIEGEIAERGVLGSREELLGEKIKNLEKISREFPFVERELEKEQKILNELNEQKGKLKEEMAKAQLLERIEDEKKTLKRVNEKEKDMEGIRKEIKEYEFFTEKVLKKAASLNNTIQKNRASLSGATLEGTLLESPGKVYVTKGFNGKEELSAGSIFSAEGYFKLETPEGLNLEVRAGKIKFEELKKEYEEAKKELEEIFGKLRVKTIEEVETGSKMLSQLITKRESLENDIELILDGKDLSRIKKRIEEAIDLKARPLSELDGEKENLDNTVNNCRVKRDTLETRLKQLKEEYDSPKKVIEDLADIQVKQKEVHKKLSSLPELPEEFDSPEEFKESLSTWREKRKRLEEEENIIAQEYYQIEARFPETSYEELSKQYRLIEQEFEKEKERMHRIKTILETFDEILEEKDRDSFKPLQGSFSKYLNKLTLGNYDAGWVDVDEKLDIKVRRSDGISIPVNLFSSGTYDCVSLAFRFAVLEHLFQGKSSLLILDDCLVNLDPERTKEAIGLIRSFAENNQVIFSTCKPETTKILGGNVINLK